MSLHVGDGEGVAPSGGGEVRAWDGPTRFFHWSLVALIFCAWASRKWGDEALVWHKWNGYAVLVLIIWRILWGICGSSTARFAAFLYWPWTAAKYAFDFVVGRPRKFLGHNPLGAAMVFALLGMVGLQGGLGLISYDDHDAMTGGPLAGRVSDATWGAATKWHIAFFDYLLIAIGLHITANILYLVWKRENLIKAMVTGRKPRAPYEDQREARIAGTGRALLCLIVAAVIVFGGITAAGGRIF
jgi:cytochrome b